MILTLKIFKGRLRFMKEKYMLKLDRRKLDLAMAAKCYNLVDVTKKAGLSTALITKVTSGKYVLTTKTLGKIAKALDVEPVDLVKDEEEK